jgi:hypothetical protein
LQKPINFVELSHHLRRFLDHPEPAFTNRQPSVRDPLNANGREARAIQPA